MTSIKKLAILFFTMTSVGCIAQKDGNQNITQGVRGNITWLEGNVMPSPDEPNLGKGRGIKRKLLIYEAVDFKKVQGEAPLFKKVNAMLVKEIESNKDGMFAAELPEGVYSIFVLEPTGMLFANNFDGNGLINVVKVVKGKVDILNVEVNYKAAY